MSRLNLPLAKRSGHNRTASYGCGIQNLFWQLRCFLPSWWGPPSEGSGLKEATTLERRAKDAKKQEKLGFYHDPLGLAKLSLAGAAENMPRLYASLQLAKLASPKDLLMPTSVFFTK